MAISKLGVSGQIGGNNGSIYASHPYYISEPFLPKSCGLLSAKQKAGLASTTDVAHCAGKQGYIASYVPKVTTEQNGLPIYNVSITDTHYSVACQAPWSASNPATYTFPKNLTLGGNAISISYRTMFIEESPETIFIEDAGSIKPPADWVGNLEDVPAF